MADRIAAQQAEQGKPAPKPRINRHAKAFIKWFAITFGLCVLIVTAIVAWQYLQASWHGPL